MSILIDRQYLNYLSNRLERFRWIRNSVAVCRCPFCGDGKRGTKTRGYFYENVKYGSTGFNYQCKNCGHSESFHNFLKGFDAGMYRDYRLEKFRHKFGREPRDLFQDLPPKQETQVVDKEYVFGATKLSELPSDHPCVKYVLGRKIPEKFLDYFLYTENFQELTAGFKDPEYAKRLPEDARLIIPFYSQFGEMLCYQGRSLDPNNKLRYISIKKSDDLEKTFGLDRIDTTKEVRVCEGPIDSLFIDNCLASADADLTRVDGDVYIYDAQYRNKDVCRHINNTIGQGKKVVLFPKEFIWKDINDAVMAGISLNDIEKLIKEHTYQGLKAKLVFAKLRGC